ncbi:MAG: hypothetical protein IT469_01670 [Pseudomonadales bacterium]|nr:hypothetical protein [Pseudomonadales bacterium]
MSLRNARPDDVVGGLPAAPSYALLVSIMATGAIAAGVGVAMGSWWALLAVVPVSALAANALRQSPAPAALVCAGLIVPLVVGCCVFLVLGDLAAMRAESAESEARARADAAVQSERWRRATELAEAQVDRAYEADWRDVAEMVRLITAYEILADPNASLADKSEARRAVDAGNDAQAALSASERRARLVAERKRELMPTIEVQAPRFLAPPEARRSIRLSGRMRTTAAGLAGAAALIGVAGLAVAAGGSRRSDPPPGGGNHRALS